MQASQDNSSTTPIVEKSTGILDRRHSTSDESSVTHLIKLQKRKNSLSITEENEHMDESDDHPAEIEAFKEKILNTKLTDEEGKDSNELPREKMLLRGQSQAVIPVSEE